MAFVLSLVFQLKQKVCDYEDLIRELCDAIGLPALPKPPFKGLESSKHKNSIERLRRHLKATLWETANLTTQLPWLPDSQSVRRQHMWQASPDTNPGHCSCTKSVDQWPRSHCDVSLFNCKESPYIASSTLST
jgi:hypothetical protein